MGKYQRKLIGKEFAQIFKRQIGQHNLKENKDYICKTKTLCCPELECESMADAIVTYVGYGSASCKGQKDFIFGEAYIWRSG